jgi:hypothetical protein
MSRSLSRVLRQLAVDVVEAVGCNNVHAINAWSCPDRPAGTCCTKWTPHTLLTLPGAAYSACGNHDDISPPAHLLDCCQPKSPVSSIPLLPWVL